MINIQVIAGVELENTTGLPSVPRTPIGRAMGGIPSWSLLIDPALGDSESLRNGEVDLGRSINVIGELNYGQFPNAERAIVCAADTAIDIPIAPLNRNAWTWFCVVKPDNVTTIQRWVRAPTASGAVALNISTGSDGLGPIVYETSVLAGGEPTRILWTDGRISERETPSLIMVTFSTELGMRIYDAGSTVATEPGETQPLSYDIDSVELFRNFSGHMGMCGLLNIDLSAEINSGYRRSIERFLMDKYGIPE